ncbi:MAG: nucleotide exchange factor GrpE [Treponema sp.]|jgi:molecular chaperone GrpE|nr:nucleotide exchange factor GrpE [Treponema sp.]
MQNDEETKKELVKDPDITVLETPTVEPEIVNSDSNDARVAQLEAENAALKDQYLRKAADFENFRKRMTREKQDAIEFANQSLLLDIVQVIDDFERAIKSAETSQDFQSFLNGVNMIENRLSSELENKWGLKRFNSAGELFDPNRHEALMMEKSTDVTEATVVEDLVKGYTLKDRVIRAAKVKVAMPELRAGN